MNDINISWAALLALIGAAGTIFTIVYAVKGGKRSEKRDTAEEAGQLARIETTLASVRTGVDDIRVEMRSQQKQINDHETRLIRIETRCQMKGENHAEQA